MSDGSHQPRRWLVALAVFAATVLQTGTPALSAQEPVRVSGDVACDSCVITLDTILTIGGLDGPGLHVISYFSLAALDRRGRLLVVDPTQQPDFSVFDSTGAFVRSVGRFGEGPGEYEIISHIDVGPRYIHVFDYEKSRTLLDHDFGVVRADRLPADVYSTAVTAAEDVVFVGDVGTPTSVGHQLHILRASGELESFGDDDSAVYRRGSPRQIVESFGDNEGSLWAVRTDTNRLTRWRLAPTVEPGRVVDRVVQAFDNDVPSTFSWPLSSNRGAMLDDDGLWIVWETPDPEWTERRSQGGLPTEPWDTILDGWLDLVDPDTGATLARYHTDGILLGFVARSRYVLGYHETEAGVPYLHLLRPELSMRDNGRAIHG